jgi:Glycosyltransferase family 87
VLESQGEGGEGPQSAGARPGRSGLAAAAARVLTVIVFAVLPIVLAFSFVAVNWNNNTFLSDFKGDLYQAGRDVVHGQNPYPAAFLTREAAAKREGRPVDTAIAVPDYPAPALVLAAPLSLLPYRAAGVLFMLLSVGALLLALRLLEVEDWRCYGLAFLSWPVLHGLRLGALTPLLVLGVAAAWRWRDHLWRPVLAIVAIVSAKLFLWPLAIWLLLTRRFQTILLACFLGAITLLAGWAVIGFAGLVGYPQLLNNLASLEEGVGVSLVAGLLAIGLGRTVATVGALVIVTALFGLAWRLRSRPANDRRTFELAVIAALVASPIVWPHYFALLLVPIALLSPRLSPIWFVPLVAYLAPVAQTNHRPWEVLPYYLIAAAVAYQAVQSSRPFRAQRVVDSVALHAAAPPTET